jgi:hypothetical protein
MTLSRPKHPNWHCPVELVSAEHKINIESIWNHAVNFKEQVGPEYLLKRRQ